MMSVSASASGFSTAILDGPVALLLVGVEGNMRALTLTSFSEAAHQPTSLWIALPSESPLCNALQESPRFSLALLGTHHKHIALARAPGRAVPPDRLDVYPHGEGFWFLRGAISCTACRVRERVNLGTHAVFLGDILSGLVDSRRVHQRPLLISDL